MNPILKAELQGIDENKVYFLKGSTLTRLFWELNGMVRGVEGETEVNQNMWEGFTVGLDMGALKGVPANAYNMRLLASGSDAPADTTAALALHLENRDTWKPDKPVDGYDGALLQVATRTYNGPETGYVTVTFWRTLTFNKFGCLTKISDEQQL